MILFAGAYLSSLDAIDYKWIWFDISANSIFFRISLEVCLHQVWMLLEVVNVTLIKYYIQVIVFFLSFVWCALHQYALQIHNNGIMGCECLKYICH